MKREYTYQDLDLFFERFKSMPEYITLEQVTQFIQHPKPSSSFHFKGSTFKLWSILITAASVITISTILYFSLSGSSNQIQEQSIFYEKSIPPAVTNPVAMTDSSESVSQEINQHTPIVQTNQDENESEIREPTESDQNNIIPIKKSQKQIVPDEPFDGNPYIIDDLTMEELRKLGFDIQHYAVFYRNTFPETDYYFISVNKHFSNLSRIAPSLHWAEPERVNKDSFILNRDTLPKETMFSVFIKTKWHIPGQKPESTKHWFSTTNKDYYPVFFSTLEDSVFGILSVQEFDQLKDTLIPISIPFSRLNCIQKKDMIFWFKATDNFFEDIPDRHKKLKSIFVTNKLIKEPNHDVQSKNYDFDKWIASKAYSTDEVIDGSSFIMELTLAEQEKIGLFRDKKNETKFDYCYITPWAQISWAESKMTWIKTPNIQDRDSIYFTNFDNVFKADFLPDYITDTIGNDISSSTTGKILQSSLIENDVLIPIKVSDRIYWFTQSDSLWALLPQHYQHLQETYRRILFTKSMYPNIDLVRYFGKDREHVDMNVEILDLNKDELENIGFAFYKDSVASHSSVFNAEWVQFKVNKPPFYSLFPEGHFDDKELEIYYKGLTHVVNENNKDWQLEYNKFDYEELLNIPFRGYQVALITDEKGQELQRFNSKAREVYLSGSESQYLIPVRVPLDKLFSEHSETKVFWFTPTETFFDRLPDRITKDLRQDYYMVSGNIEGSSCTYFEECRSTLELEEFMIYPNPAKENITVSFNASEECIGQIYLLDIKGSIVKTLASKINILSGRNELHYSFDGIKPGIYLLTVQSISGIKTGRLIVSE